MQNSTQNPGAYSSWYLSAMERLVAVVRELSHARDVNAITLIVRDAARNLTGADGATFVLREGDQCYYAEENAIKPLWKGKRFPISACVSGLVMTNAKSVMIEDIYSNPNVPFDAYRPTFVKSLAMVPIRRNAPIGAIGNYWANRHLATEEEITILQALADTTSVALENAELYGKLQQQVATLQQQRACISEQHDALEVFTRALAHDLKEPVRTMMAFTRMIEDGYGSPEKQQSYFRFIQNAADRMGMLIDSVFQYTQLDEPGQIAKISCVMQEIMEGVKENLTRLIEERGATVHYSALPEIHANPAHMLQVIQNLVINAIRHNEGRVSVEVVAKEREGDWLFSVRDNGAGIAQEQMKNIFLPFKGLTHGEDHAGLGWPSVKRLLRSMAARYGASLRRIRG